MKNIGDALDDLPNGDDLNSGENVIMVDDDNLNDMMGMDDQDQINQLENSND